MHIQIRTSLTTAGFTDDLDAPDGSVAYLAGSLSDLLALLAEDRGPSDPPFSLGAASGHAIELGGEFSFWVHPREGVDADEHVAQANALARVQEVYDAKDYTVEFRMLNDRAGTLQGFVADVTKAGLHVVEISVGTATDEGVPVQIFAARTSTGHTR